MRFVLVAATLAATLTVVTAGCGGGGDGAASGDTTAEATTEETTTGTVSKPGTLEETDGSFSPDSPVCKEVTNQGSPLNIAASTGDFETAASRWEALSPEVPASLRPDVKNLAAGYRKIAQDPAGFGVLDTEPYRSSLVAVNEWTATNCAP
jgi:hypothetical protein